MSKESYKQQQGNRMSRKTLCSFTRNGTPRAFVDAGGNLRGVTKSFFLERRVKWVK